MCVRKCHYLWNHIVFKVAIQISAPLVVQWAFLGKTPQVVVVPAWDVV